MPKAIFRVLICGGHRHFGNMMQQHQLDANPFEPVSTE